MRCIFRDFHKNIRDIFLYEIKYSLLNLIRFLALWKNHVLQLITWLQSWSPNWMVVTSSSFSTTNAIEQFIFSAEPHSYFRTFVHCVVMRGGPSWTFSNGLAWRAIHSTTSYTRIKRIASISASKVIFHTICFCVTSIVNIPLWWGIRRIYRFL